MALPELDQGFIDVHDNGANPARGKTRWGLTIDLQESKHRWNINFEVVSDSEFISLAESDDLTPEQQTRVLELATIYVEKGWHANPLVHLAYGKRNVRAGKGPYKLVPDYDVLALLDLRNGSENPSVGLTWGDEAYFLEDWYSPYTPNGTIVARHDLKVSKLEAVE